MGDGRINGGLGAYAAVCTFPKCPCVGSCAWAKIYRQAPGDVHRKPTSVELASKEHPGNGKRCPYCQRVMIWNNFNLRPTVDHRIPQALGGRNIAGNRLIACYSCNHSKANYTLIEWLVFLLHRGDWRAATVWAFIEVHPESSAEIASLRAAMLE